MESQKDEQGGSTESTDDQAIAPAEGERRAIGGYRGQYTVAAVILLRLLHEGRLDAVRIADPDAGRLDDFICLSPGALDAYQVKWGEFPGRISFNDLSSQSDSARGLIRDMAEGWKRLRSVYPDRQVRVHLVTSDIAHSQPKAFLPIGNPPPARAHFAAFLLDSWPTRRDGCASPSAEWAPALSRLRETTGLSEDEFNAFSRSCFLDFGYSIDVPLLPTREQHRFEADRSQVARTLFDLVGDPRRLVQLSRAQLLDALGWSSRATYRNPHAFPVDPRYEPIEPTVEALRSRISGLSSGYIAVVGAPGSGKSTLLTESLRRVDAHVIAYYAFVPGASEFGPIRGEAESFLHDLCLSFHQQGFDAGSLGLPGSDLNSLRQRLGRQLAAASERFQQDGRKTIILVDGLDHIGREQSPLRSLLEELPLPAQIEPGVLFILGSQRTDFLKPAIRRSLGHDAREIQIQPISRQAVQRVIDRVTLPMPLSPQQVDLLIDRANGHPLALAYLLNRLSEAHDSTEVTKLLDSEARYQGDIESLYSSHWDQVVGNAPVVTLLGHICRWDGPFNAAWFRSWSGEGAMDHLLRHFRHFLRHDGGDRWTLFHNSFRLFLLDSTSEDSLGQHDGSRDHVYHRDLARACEAADDATTRSLALLYWHRAGDHERVTRLATQRRFRQAKQQPMAEQSLKWYGPCVNLYPAIFNLMVQVVLLAQDHDVAPDDEAFKRLAQAVAKDRADGHPVTVTGDIYCQAGSVDAVLAGLMAK